jgi:hypothetical protein
MARLRRHFKLRYLFFFSVLTWAARAPEAFTGDMELNTAAQMGVVFQALLINLAWATGKNPWDAVKKFGRGRGANIHDADLDGSAHGSDPVRNRLRGASGGLLPRRMLAVLRTEKRAQG